MLRKSQTQKSTSCATPLTGNSKSSVISDVQGAVTLMGWWLEGREGGRGVLAMFSFLIWAPVTLQRSTECCISVSYTVIKAEGISRFPPFIHPCSPFTLRDSVVHVQEITGHLCNSHAITSCFLISKMKNMR